MENNTEHNTLRVCVCVHACVRACVRVHLYKLRVYYHRNYTRHGSVINGRAQYLLYVIF